MKSYLLRLMLCGLLVFFVQAPFANPAPEAGMKPLRLAYAPIISATIVEQRSQELVAYLQQQHQITMTLHHSISFKDYVEDAVRGEFDIAVSQINYAEAFSSQLGFTPIVQTSRQYHVLVLVPKYSQLSSVMQLKGKRVGVPAGLSFISALFHRELIKQGLHPNQDIELRLFKRHDQLFVSLLKQRIDAGITVEITLDMAPKFREHLVTIDKIPAGPAVFTVANRAAGKMQQRLQQALLQFVLTEAGKRYLALFSFESLVPVSYENIAPYGKFADAIYHEINSYKTVD